MSRYPELAGKVDAFFTRVQARHGDQMRCGSGCHHCCHVRLSITRVEADAIRAEIATWPVERKTRLTANAAAAATDRCPALAPDGLCLVYAARPSGQEPAEFESIAVTDSSITFENAAHDFPQRVIYRRLGADSLVARVEGTRGGRVRGTDFPYRRAACA